MKRILIFSVFIVGFASVAFSQLTVENCREMARDNFPLIRKYRLLEQAEEYSLSNASKTYLPQFQISARATYQSDVTTIPISFPGINIPSISKDQYQAVIEANQLIWDGGAVGSQRKITKAGTEVERMQIEVELHALDDRINQLFFGILMLDSQSEQNQILQDELQRNYSTVASYIAQGVANQADLDAVKVEQLNAKQVQTQIQSAQTAYIEMLSIMTGQKWNETPSFEKPDLEAEYGDAILSQLIHRPELLLFEAQNELLNSQKEWIKSTYMPKLGVFIQGGFGRPGLNMLSDSFDPFYIGGIRLVWNFGSLYTQKNDLRKIDINKGTVEVQKDVFLYNISLAKTKENQEIQRIKKLMKDDDEIISLRENIRKSVEAKVANGTSTVVELMRELSHENLARQAKATHEIDLLIAIYNLKNITNNL
jgi:outer membrane protein TolC